MSSSYGICCKECKKVLDPSQSYIEVDERIKDGHSKGWPNFFCSRKCLSNWYKIRKGEIVMKCGADNCKNDVKNENYRLHINHRSKRETYFFCSKKHYKETTGKD